MQQKFKKLVFLDDTYDAERAVVFLGAKKRWENGEVLFISLIPSVQATLSEHGLTVENTLPYFTQHSHERVLQQSERLVGWLGRNSVFSDPEVGVEKGYQQPFIFFSRTAIHYCLWVLEIVSNAVERHRPERLVAAYSGSRAVPGVLIQSEERCLGLLVKAVAQARGLSFEDICLRRDTPRHLISRVRIRPKPTFVALLMHLVKFKIWAAHVARHSNDSEKGPVLFTSRFYQMGRLMDRLKEENPSVTLCLLKGPFTVAFTLNRWMLGLFWKNEAPQIYALKEKILKVVQILEQADTPFAYRGVSFARVIARKIRTGVMDHVIGLAAWSPLLAKALDKIHPRAVVTNGCRDDEVLLAELCRQKGIPSLMISHGSHVYPKNEFERIEWGEHGGGLIRASFSHVAFQTPLAEGYRQVFPSDSSPVVTGPLLWGMRVDARRSQALFSKLLGNRFAFGRVKVVVHAGTPKWRNALRFHVYETTDEYLQALRDLAGAVGTLADTVLIVRFRPTHEISIRDLRALVSFSDRVILSIEEPFLDILGMADLFTSFSSTAIEEALQNRIPVLLYGGGGRYQHVLAQEIVPGAPLKASAVFHVSEAGGLPTALNQIFNLRLGADNGGHLFEPYIYPREVRTSLVDWLNGRKNEEVFCENHP